MGYNRVITEKHRLEQLAHETQTKYRGGAFWDEKQKRYLKWSFSDHSKTPSKLKRQSNKKIRKTNQIPNFGGYRKVFDYWWTLT